VCTGTASAPWHCRWDTQHMKKVPATRSRALKKGKNCRFTPSPGSCLVGRCCEPAREACSAAPLQRGVVLSDTNEIKAQAANRTENAMAVLTICLSCAHDRTLQAALFVQPV
jgi:hypothetical protein